MKNRWRMWGNEKQFPKFDFKCLFAVAKETSCMCVCMCVSVCARVSVYSLFIAAIRSNNQGKTTQFALFVFHTHRCMWKWGWKQSQGSSQTRTWLLVSKDIRLKLMSDTFFVQFKLLGDLFIIWKASHEEAVFHLYLKGNQAHLFI